MTGASALSSAVVRPDLAGERLDRVSAVLFPDHSRSRLAEWIRAGSLTLDGRVVAPKHRVSGGELLTLAVPTRAVASNAPLPQEVAFRVVFEDDDVLVIDKPAGVVVHPGAGRTDGTLVNGLVRHRPALAALPRAGLIHRLDKDTSGLLIVGTSAVSIIRLTRALARHDIVRLYRAVAEGRMTGGRTVDAPIGRDPRHRLRQRVRDDGRAAITHLRVLERYRAHSYVEAQLATGRTHQIRVHMSAIGYPLVGDTRYGARGRLPSQPLPALFDAIRSFKRQALHAWKIAFEHPQSRAPLAFSSDVPADIAALIDRLREDNPRDA